METPEPAPETPEEPEAGTSQTRATCSICGRTISARFMNRHMSAKHSDKPPRRTARAPKRQNDGFRKAVLIGKDVLILDDGVYKIEGLQKVPGV